jgi:3-methylfumaryl-CoA hydratase
MQARQDYQSVYREEVCSLAAARRVAAMLDLDPDSFKCGMPLPRGWHFTMMGADTRRRELRKDGFPGLGVALPDFGLPRLLLGGRTVEYRDEIPIGATVARRSAVTAITEKYFRQGPATIVDIAHDLTVDDKPVVRETQTYFALPAAEGDVRTSRLPTTPITAQYSRAIVPDELLLFQFSALGFNSHLIHLDKSYAREIEGYPDIVVNGGLTTLLLTEFARNDLGLRIYSFTMKNVSPLYCGRQITLTADRNAEHWSLKAFDDTGNLAANMEVKANDL